MSDTPRTDDQIGHKGSTMKMVRIDFARQLERELNEAIKFRLAYDTFVKAYGKSPSDFAAEHLLKFHHAGDL